MSLLNSRVRFEALVPLSAIQRPDLRSIGFSIMESLGFMVFDPKYLQPLTEPGPIYTLGSR